MNDIFDEIDIDVLDNNIRPRIINPKHIFIVYAYIDVCYNVEKLRRILNSVINTFCINCEIDISNDVEIFDYGQENASMHYLKVTISTNDSFRNVHDVIRFIDAICYGKYIQIISKNTQFLNMYIKYMNNEMELSDAIDLTIPPEIYLSKDNSDFKKKDFIISMYTNSMIKICDFVLNRKTNESEIRNCTGMIDRESLLMAQSYHAACLRMNDIITVDCQMNISEDVFKNYFNICGCFIADQEKKNTLLEIFSRAYRIKNLDNVLDDETVDSKNRKIIKTIGCSLYNPNDKNKDYVAVWDGVPSVHHPEDAKYLFFMKLFYKNRKQISKLFRFPTAVVPKIADYDNETEYIKLVLRLGTVYDEKTKNTVIVTMGLCGNFDSVMNCIKKLYRL